MTMRRSPFAHVLRLAGDRALVIHAVSQLRLSIDREVANLVEYFDAPRELETALPDLASRFPYDRETLLGCLATLVERGIISDQTPEQEQSEITQRLSETYGRDPGELLDEYRRERTEGAVPYWSITASNGIADMAGPGRRLDILLFGDCELQMEADFLRREGARRGLDLRIAATFPDDARFAGERAHDAIVIGALRSRHAIALGSAADHGGEPFRLYVSEARILLENLRSRTAAPILIDNLPEPTVQPLGLADRGVHGHRNRFRQANLALARLAEEFADVHVVDVAATLAASGSEHLLDDGLVSFTHFGSSGWMLQRPESEKAAVHGLFPDTAQLAELVGGDPYAREAAVARAHMDVLAVALGIDRKKCVVVDLDGVLWPGVLAETGAPFDWHPETSGAYSYVGLYFGIHEALKSLQRRGILLASVSKNDEATVRELWKYPAHYPHDRLLRPEDFVTWRVNWNDKSENIRSIAEELGFALETLVFVDDHPIERERVRTRLPEVTIYGDNLFTLRRSLLTDPRLQLPRITKESGVRTDLVKAQLSRARLRAAMVEERDFIASLGLECVVEELGAGANMDRLQELFQRTTQFNTTGRKFTVAELSEILDSPSGHLFTMRVRDKFGDHGMVGGAVAVAGEIVGFALSCRVIGLGVEHVFLDRILVDLAGQHAEIVARIIETSRNRPVRNLYKDHGFTVRDDNSWHIALRQRELARA